MMENDTMAISSEELKIAFEGKGKSAAKPMKSAGKGNTNKRILVLLIIGIVGIVGGGVMLTVALLWTSEDKQIENFEGFSSEEKKDEVYSALTGEALADKSLVNAPAYCIQTPNGLDGARPQSGINEAGVVFEAIAEAGITRFAAIYQNPSAAVIGPIRSLRIYYLEWDTPFDCTIVHAGGADDALAAVSAGGYKDLSEDYAYMYRGTYGSRLWNNLFTTSAYLKKFSEDKGYNTSNIKGFARMTPDESDKARVDGTAVEKLVITEPAQGDTSAVNPEVTTVGIRFGGVDSFNVSYNYDAATNTYARSYQSGVAHEVYNCPGEDLGEKNPEDACTLKQLNPSVVVAMVVSERKAADGYHEAIDAIGSGDAYIFQNGMAIHGAWKKSSREEQIKFTDADGKEIKLAPGQTFISAVPNYGSVDF